MVEREGILVLNQLVLSLEENFEIFKRAFEEKDSKKFNKFKKLIIQYQKEISKILS